MYGGSFDGESENSGRFCRTKSTDFCWGIETHFGKKMRTGYGRGLKGIQMHSAAKHHVSAHRDRGKAESISPRETGIQD